MFHFTTQNSSNNLSEEELQSLLMEIVQQKQHRKTCQQKERILNSGGQPIPLVVAKASHLTTGNSVFLLLSDGSVNTPQPVGPGKTVMLENQRKNNVLTYVRKVNNIFGRDVKSRDDIIEIHYYSLMRKKNSANIQSLNSVSDHMKSMLEMVTGLIFRRYLFQAYSY